MPGMANRSINLRGLAILVADPSPYLCMLVHGILRGFGADKVLEARDSSVAIEILTGQKVDILLCDASLSPQGGLSLTNSLRRSEKNKNRTIPILIMTSETRETMVKSARDVGANMVIAKPMSPASLYDRLTWVAFNPRQFVESATHFGPDRRFKIVRYPNGGCRRKGDNVIEVAEGGGPTPAQDDIGNLVGAAQSGLG